jgi:glycosyltransferase involved in cell wall biosynthesis
LVICDDNSTDGTCSIIEQYKKKAMFPIKIRHNKRRLGIVNNFEQAISLTQGDIIILSDQDDIWMENKLQIFKEIFSDDHEAGYAFSDAITIDGLGRISQHSLWKLVSFNSKRRAMFSISPENQVQVLLGGNVVTGATMGFRSWLKAIILPMPEFWMHDEWIALIASLKGARGILIEEPLIYYRQHEAQALGLQRLSGINLVKRAWHSFMGNAQAYEFYQLEMCRYHTSTWPASIAASLAPTTLSVLKAKMAHVELRAKLHHWPRRARIPSIVMQLVRRQYHFYSGGWKSAIKDFWVPAAGDSLSARLDI